MSVVLYNSPYSFDGLHTISLIFFFFNILLFFLFLLATFLRYTLYPSSLSTMLLSPAQSLYLGTMPMGLSTIITMIVISVVPYYGTWAVWLAWVLWWVDAFLSILSCFGVPLLMYVSLSLSLPPLLSLYHGFICLYFFIIFHCFFFIYSV